MGEHSDDRESRRASVDGDSVLPDLIEVLVRKDGGPYSRVKLKRGRASFGRDVAADVQLASKHVSRVHLELWVSEREVRVRDSGSRNGIRLGGSRVEEAGLRAGEIVSLPGFEVSYRWLAVPGGGVNSGDTDPSPPPIQPQRAAHEEIGGGWDEYFAGEQEDEEPIREQATRIAPRPVAPGAQPAPPPPPEASSGGSVLNRLVYRRESGQRHALDLGSNDGDDDPEATVAPDVDPLILTLHDEANALLYGTNAGDIGVEVIETIGDQVHQMVLLAPGESFWWGKPLGAAKLWRAPDRERFTVVEHTRRGEFRVQHPNDGTWRMFHRGQREMDIYRAGSFLRCDAEWEDQVEVTYGPYAIYVRCVRTPDRVPAPIEFHKVLPNRLSVAAVIVSAVFHVIFGALPAITTPAARIGLTYHSDVFVEYHLPDPTYVPPQPPPVPPRPSPVRVEHEDAPDVGRRKALSLSPKVKRKRRRARNRGGGGQEIAPVDNGARTETALDPSDAVSESTPKTDAKRRSVTVDNFKVYGMIGHLPELQLAPGRASRGSRRVLRGGPAKGVVNKSSNLMGIDPLGTLSKEQVGRVVNGNTRAIYSCYAKLLDIDSSAQGRIEAVWVVDGEGNVAAVRVLKDTVGSTTMVKCLRQAIRGWRFPAPKGGAAQITFPFVFRRPRL